jgi:hypothetical protein
MLPPKSVLLPGDVPLPGIEFSPKDISPPKSVPLKNSANFPQDIFPRRPSVQSLPGQKGDVSLN